MKNITWFFLLLPVVLLSQEFRKCPSFDANENWLELKAFQANEKTVLNLLEWLVSTPPTEQLIERSSASIFAMEWVTKHPTLVVNVEVGPYNDYFISEDLMLGYLFGNILYSLKHEGKIKPEAQRIAGLKSLLFLVEHSESYSKNRVFKSLLRADRKGELLEFDKEMWKSENAHVLKIGENKSE